MMKPSLSVLALAVSSVLLTGAAGVAGAAGGTAAYTADPQQSRLEFAGVQAGAEFKGVFKNFTAAIEFAPDALANARFDVQIDLKSETPATRTGIRPFGCRRFRCGPLADGPLRHPHLSKTAAGFTAVGALTLRGVTKDVPIDFRFAQTAAGAKLEGSAKLKRLDFGAGQGDWRAPTRSPTP